MGKRTQKLMLKDLAKKTLYLGYVGENVHTQIIIDCSEVFWDYPDAVPRLNVTPPRGDKYRASQLVKDGDDLIWTITNSDIVYSGSGHVQLQFVDGDEVIKTAVGTTKIDGSIETTGDAPTPLEDWMQQAEETAHQIALTAKDEVIEQIQDAAEEARESIPADYTQLSDDVTELKSAFTQLDANVITESAGPSPIVSIADGADGMPVRKVEVAIEPVQDLHGYEYPWPAGGGKNLLKVTASTNTVNGVTFTINEDGTISCSGNATDTIIFNVCRWTGTSGTEYILNGCPSGGSGSKYKLDYNNSPYVIDNGSGVSFSASGNEGMVRIVIYAGYGNGLVFKPMIRLATETDATFAPYSNVCPISGWTGAKVTRTGKNLFGGEINQLAFVLKYPGSAIVSGQKFKGIYASVEAGKTYTISRKTIEGNRFRVSASVETPADNIPCIILSNGSENDSKYAVTVTVPSGYNYIFVYLSNQSDTCTSGNYMIELGSTVSAYEAPSIQSVTIPFGQTVYGGTLDVASGKLVVDRAGALLNDPDKWVASTGTTTTFTYTYPFADRKKDYGNSYDGLSCSYMAVSATSPEKTARWSSATGSTFGLRWTNGNLDQVKADALEGKIGIVYNLASPIEITLSPTEITTLLGINNVFADCGDTAITYPADTKMYIDRKITEAVANALNA